MNKKDYEEPVMQVVPVQMEAHLLAGSNDKGYEVIGTDPPNTPAGARSFSGGLDDGWDSWDDWDE